VRKPRRTAATASALMIGVALVTVVATIVASAKASVEGTVRDEVIGEYQVEPTSFGSVFTGGLSTEIASRLRALPEVAVASTYRVGEWRVPGSGEDLDTAYATQAGVKSLIAVDQGADEVVRLGVSSGDFADLARPGTVMLHEDFAAEEGLGVGDAFPIGSRQLHRDLEVAAVCRNRPLCSGVVISWTPLPPPRLGLRPDGDRPPEGVDRGARAPPGAVVAITT
jgi:putative ABC transport system permease protein